MKEIIYLSVFGIQYIFNKYLCLLNLSKNKRFALEL